MVPFDRRSVHEVTARLGPVSDAVLVGEHHARPDFPPVLMATTVADAGGRAWITLSCRDRNRVVLESELEALAALDVAGVHCVTGDARGASVRPDATQVFDLDALRLAAVARQAGLRVSVAATPAAPPTALRPAAPRREAARRRRRLLREPCRGPGSCRRLRRGGRPRRVRRSGSSRASPCSPTSDRWPCCERFPGLVVDPDGPQRVLASVDPRQTGIDVAVEQALAMLAIDGVVGVNLSGSATTGPELESAAIMAEVAGRIRERRVGA